MNPHLTKNKFYGKSRSLLIVTAAYVLAGIGALGAYSFAERLGPFWGVLVADLFATLIIWAVGAHLMNASLYDPYWSVIPPAVAVFWWSLTGFDMDPGRVMIFLVVLWWAIRLTSNWARDWPGLHHEDWRYQEMRAENPKTYLLVANLMGINLFPTVLVFLGMLPLWPVLAGNGDSILALDIIAFIIGIGAATIQLFADGQMRNFRFKKQANETNQAFYTEGLWAWSRHPNYFGEVAMWFSLWLFAMSAGVENWWTGIGWVAMLILFLFVSCPWMDRRSAAKRPGYAEHMKTSNLFFMTPPRKKTES